MSFVWFVKCLYLYIQHLSCLNQLENCVHRRTKMPPTKTTIEKYDDPIGLWIDCSFYTMKPRCGFFLHFLASSSMYGSGPLQSKSSTPATPSSFYIGSRISMVILKSYKVYKWVSKLLISWVLLPKLVDFLQLLC